MRFRFFPFRRKSAEVVPTKSKKGTLCCLQSCTGDNSIDLRNLGSDVTTILHGSISSATSKNTQASSVDITPSLGEKRAHFISVKAECPDDKVQKGATPSLRRFQRVQAAVGRTETEESEAASSICGQENGLTRWHRMRSSVSSPKGPGLGSIFDNPPTRMLHERTRPNFSEYFRSQLQERRQSADVQAPELPTRLEVCSEANRRKSMPCRVEVEATTMQTREESALSSILSDSGSQEGSFSVRRSSSSSASRERNSLISLASDDSTHSSSSSRRRSVRTQSPGEISSQSTDSVHQEFDAHQQTKQLQSIETMKQMSQCGVVARCEVEVKPNVDMKTYKSADVQGNTLACLHDLRIGIRLKWISEKEDDIVTEVHMADLDKEENLKAGAGARRKSEDSHLVENYNREHQMNLVSRVDRILTELQRQKRSRARNKQRTKIASAVDSSNRNHGHLQTRKQDIAVGTENYRESCGPVQRTQRRREILQAFEVLISRMEGKVGSLDGSFQEDEIVSERSLTAAVLRELRKEVSRLERGLKEIESFGKLEVAATRTSWRPLEPNSSRTAEKEEEGEIVCVDQESGWQHSQSHQPASTSQLLRMMNGPIPEQQSPSNDTDASSLPRPHFDSCVQGRRFGMDGRPSKTALHNEETFSMQGADLERHMLRAAMW